MFDTLLTNGTIITVDSNNSVIMNGYIAIKDGCIAEIGDMKDLEVIPSARETFDMSGHAILPGLIDTHGHGGHNLIRTLGEFYDAEWDAMAEQIYFNCVDRDFWYNEAVLAAAERLKFGTTTAVSMVGSTPRVDSVEAVDANLEGSASTGIRQFSGIGFCDGPWPKKARQYSEDGSYKDVTVTLEDALAVTEKSVKELNGKYPRATAIPAPGRMGRRPYSTDEENIFQNKEMGRLSREYNLPLHTHAFGGDVKFMHETSPEVLNPSLSLAHSTGYSDEELDILKESGAFVVHGPTTYSNVMGHCKVTEMLERGINLVVVTDGTAPDRSFDLWREMKNVQLIQRYRKQDNGLVPCGLALRLVTIEPAKLLGIDGYTGSLEVGKKADIITVNVMQPHLAPFKVMPIQRLVYHAMGQDVDNVFVEGELVVKDRKLTKIDEKEMYINAEKSFDLMLERLGRDDIFDDKNLYALNHYVKSED